MILTEKIIDSLNQIKLSGESYMECYLEETNKLREVICESNVYSYEEKSYLLFVLDGMYIWYDTVEKIVISQNI
ncbi:unnamed protein product [marine sediment metagenome]|uniref:Uncharacterized protein n=1 Tax=marine sediment metagenome TaxID=412755 RepID=X1CAU5_9ZZZZ